MSRSGTSVVDQGVGGLRTGGLLVFLDQAETGRKWVWLWFWAAAICYAQVYVGKHYPFDMLAGAGFGILTGWGTYRLLVYWEDRLGHPIFANPPGGGFI